VDLDVIVVTHQSGAALEECMSGLPEEQRRRFIVVDNASTDDSAQIARSHGARVLVQTDNLGFAQAANVGARCATASFLCFLNPDCVPNAALFEAGVERLRADEDLCVAPELHEPGGVVVSGCQPGYSVAKLLHDALQSNYRAAKLAAWLRRLPGFDDVTWTWPHGACFFIGRRQFLRLGGFDTRYFLYMEDVDFGHRLWRAGGRVAALNSSLRHRARQGARISRLQRLGHLDAARIRYAALHHGRAAALTVALLSAPGLVAQAAKQALDGWRIQSTPDRLGDAQ
jgi:GT2 family glycosyltransferase